eukprot:TRINITY_DN5578_c0_g1_i1.p1 TRINITY_DN5578_c0_g1~~TRINITY_DN5578_c0_g1_i1.p1  ORF type:complete len:154 (-),score=26.81 TRINITY_DN5578_c0_g1_i1:74-535(-)
MRVVLFIGGGNMSSAIIGGLNRSTWKPIVCEINQEQRDKVSKSFSVETVSSLTHSVVQAAEVIVFAVKPQSTKSVLQSMVNLDLSNKIVLSIMAGVPISTLKSGIKGANIKFVRAMPNTPMLVGKGVTGIFSDTHEAYTVAKVSKNITSLVIC